MTNALYDPTGSLKQKVLSAISNKNLKDVISDAFKKGWRVSRVPEGGSTKAQIVWTDGQTVGFNTTSLKENSYKLIRGQIQTISGPLNEEVKRAGKIKKSPDKVVGFSTTRRTGSAEEWAKRIESQIDLYKHLACELKVIVMAGSDVNHTDINRCVKIVRELIQIRDFLEMLHQPVPNMDLDLAFKLIGSKEDRLRPVQD